MEFLKHKAGVILLIVSLIVIVAAVWYLMFGMPEGGSYEGGTLVEGIRNTELMKEPFNCIWRGVTVNL